MVREPYEALSKTAPGSLARKQIGADLIQSIVKQRIISERPPKVTICVVLSYHIARLIKLVSNWKIVWSHATPMWVSWKSLFKYEALMALSAKKVPDPWSKSFIGRGI